MPIAVIAESSGYRRRIGPCSSAGPTKPSGRRTLSIKTGPGVAETAAPALQAQKDYFTRMIEMRRRKPTDDFMGILANAKLDGAWIPDFELLSYLILLVVAGNETTRNAASGGLLALIQNPGEFAKLQRNPDLARAAAEESCAGSGQ